jgi:hypothetical protein
MKIKFLVAEEIRLEAANKLTVLGLFPDCTIILNPIRTKDAPAEIPPGIDKLSLLITVSELSEGEHQFKGRIFRPSGEPYNDETSFGEANLAKGISRSIVVEIKPFVVLEYGVYRLDFYVDESINSFNFDVREQPKS